MLKINNNYRNLLISYVLMMLISGSLLVPLLNFELLTGHFNPAQFATLALLANWLPSLPFACSAVLALISNRCAYRNLAYCLCAISNCLLLVFLLLPANFSYLLLLIISLSFSYRILYFALDRQLTTILAGVIADFQSAISAWAAVLGIVNLHVANYVYQHFAVKGVVSVALFTNLILFCFVFAVDDVPKNYQGASRSSIRQILGLIWRKATVRHWFIIMPSLNLVLAMIFLLLLTMLRELPTPVNYYTQLTSWGMLAAILASLVLRLSIFRRRPRLTIIRLCLLVISFCLICLSLGRMRCYTQWWWLMLCYFLLSLAMAVVYICQNTLLLQWIKADGELGQQAPAVAGIAATILFIASSLGWLFVQMVIASGLSYSYGLLVVAMLCLIGRYLLGKR